VDYEIAYRSLWQKISEVVAAQMEHFVDNMDGTGHQLFTATRAAADVLLFFADNRRTAFN
jgi:hypothetical protein